MVCFFSCFFLIFARELLSEIILTQKFFVVAPPLSVDNVMAILSGVAYRWLDVGSGLHIPDSTLSFLNGDCGSDEERLRRVVRYWILKDPSASWRQLVQGLKDIDIFNWDESVKRNAENLTGQQVIARTTKGGGQIVNSQQYYNSHHALSCHIVDLETTAFSRCML